MVRMEEEVRDHKVNRTIDLLSPTIFGWSKDYQSYRNHTNHELLIICPNEYSFRSHHFLPSFISLNSEITTHQLVT